MKPGKVFGTGYAMCGWKANAYQRKVALLFKQTTLLLPTSTIREHYGTRISNTEHDRFNDAR